MLTIEAVRSGSYGKDARYLVMDVWKTGRNVIAVTDSIKKAACLLRFMKGATLNGKEYALAVSALEEIESKSEKVKHETVSGKTDIGVSDGSQSDRYPTGGGDQLDEILLSES